ncbi:multidrug resistance efflux pump [Methylophaga aminisulfidivorans MP]|uniref:Membrane fusion protein (MFP) family protein n=1 Tax=Methylophaga aminisulfidivorans MP TaxID=1026882 RepID=F5T0I7_9GAMM|nr:HlyD family type I secretion periplasmic adaptor subunit [Methylophaga aminisulfidivorans]EGL55343.1 multidrug resistance efflux pump [Methylophaga aminisulfidivorans MP]
MSTTQSESRHQQPEAVSQTISTDIQKYTRMGWLIVLAGFGGFLVWALLAPLDKGVPLNGKVSVATNKKAVQYQDGGTVDAILIKEGSVVKAGDVLVRMNNVQAKANAETNRVQYYIAKATEARLIAERDDKDKIEFPAMLAEISDNPRVTSYLETQKEVFFSRRNTLKSELSAISENINGLISQTKGLQASRKNKEEQLTYINEQLEGIRELEKEGYVARNRLLELEQTAAQINATISEDIGNIARAQSQVSELKLSRLRREQEYKEQVREQLSEVQRQVDALGSQLTGLDYDLEKVLVRAPASGIVVGLKVFTEGAVVAPGFKMMDIVPSEDSLVVEGQLPVHLIDKVRAGLPVELMFTAFNRNLTPHVPGEVTQISADRLIDEITGEPYYQLIAKVSPEGIEMMPDLTVKPGMPVEMFVKTGERTMMNYLLKPFIDRLKLSMTEE